jgi:hypothetical protein
MDELGRVQSRTGRAVRLWLIVWPLIFVAALTVLSECGPRTGDRKTQDGAAAPAAGESSGRGIK